MQHKKNFRHKLLAFLLTMVMIIPSFTIIPASAALPAGNGVTSLSDGNIARAGQATAQFTNGYQPADAATRVNDGVLATGVHATTWNTYGYSADGTNYPAPTVWLEMRWDQPYTIDSSRVMWGAEGNNSANVTMPVGAVIQYWNGTAFVTVSNMRDAANAAVNSVGVAGTRSAAQDDCSTMREWNGVTFDPVETDRLRLLITQVRTSPTSAAGGTGVGEWEIFGAEGEPELQSVSIDGDDTIILGTEATYTATILSAGLQGVTYLWSLNNTNASIVGSAAGASVSIKGDLAGDVRLSVTATHESGVQTASSFMDIEVDDPADRASQPYYTGTAQGKAPILPTRVVVDDLIFDAPSNRATNKGYDFYETFEESLVPVEWDMTSFDEEDYMNAPVGSAFEVTGITKNGSRAPGVLAKAVVTVNEPLAAPDYNHSVTSEHVTFNDSFWMPKQLVNATASFDAAFDRLGNTTEPENSYREEQNFIAARARLQQVWDGVENPAPRTHYGYVFADTDIYKTLEAVSYNMAAIWDEPGMESRLVTLQDKLDSWIGLIEDIQYADGYINTAFSTRANHARGNWNEGSSNGTLRWRWMSRHEMYNIGHFLESAVAYTRFREGVGEPDYRLYEVGKRAADHIVNVFGPDGYRNEVPGHEEIELALMKIATLVEEYEGVGTGQKYRDTVEALIDRRGTSTAERQSGYSSGTYSQDATPINRETQAVGHAVRAMYLYTGITDAAIAMDDSDPKKQVYLDAMNRIFGNVMERNTYITGGIGSPGSSEGFGPEWGLHNGDSYCEICAAIAMANWLQRLNLEYEDAKYADAYEKALYNAVLVGVNLAGGRFYYSTRLEGNTNRHSWDGVACCEPNILRTIANMSGYMYTVRQDNVFVNMYGGSQGEVNVEGTLVDIDQETEYPWEGDIKMTVAPAEDMNFALNLRIPGWLKAQKYQQATITIGDEVIDSTPSEKGYVTIDREWAAEGTEIRISIPMEVRMTEADNNVNGAGFSNRDRVALERGPIVYSLEDAGTGTTTANVVNATTAVISRDTEFEAVRRPDLLRDVVALNGAAAFNGAEREVTYVPYYAWHNRGRNPQDLGNGDNNSASNHVIWTRVTDAGVQIRGGKDALENGETATLMAVPKANFSLNDNQRPNEFTWTIVGPGKLVSESVGQAPTNGYEKIGGLLGSQGGKADNTVRYDAGTAVIEATEDEGMIVVNVAASYDGTPLYYDSFIILVGDFEGIAIADPVKLLQKIAEAKSTDAGRYSAASYAALVTAIEVAEAFMATVYDGTKTQEDVDAEIAKLQAAIDALVIVADFRALNAAIAEAEAIDSLEYTLASYTALYAVLVKAKAFVAENGTNEGTAQALIDAHAAALGEALIDLESIDNPTIGRNIALLATASAQYTNVYCNPGAPRMNDGELAGPLSSTDWNSYGGNNIYPDVKVWLQWDRPVEIDSLEVLWSYDGTGASSGVQLPRAATVQYLDENGEYVNVTNMRSGLTGDGEAASSIGVRGSGTGAANTIFNGVTFDEVQTTRLQLTITQARTSNSAAGGAGIFEWRAFGKYASAASADYSGLVQKLVEAKAIDAALYTAASYAVLASAVASGDAFMLTFGESDIAQESVDAETAKIDAAIKALAKKEDGTNISTDDRIVIEPVAMPGENATVFNPEFAVTANEDMEIRVIAAAYDADGKLVDIDTETVALKALVPATGLCPSVEKADGRTYKFFIWEGNMTPLTSIVTADALAQ